eukprot:1157340-Pelagomonas_calceolata.AAC.7
METERGNLSCHKAQAGTAADARAGPGGLSRPILLFAGCGHSGAQGLFGWGKNGVVPFCLTFELKQPYSELWAMLTLVGKAGIWGKGAMP